MFKKLNKISILSIFLIFSTLIPTSVQSLSSFEIYPSIFEDRLVQTRFQTVFNVKNNADGARTFSINPASFINTSTCDIDYDFDFPPTMSVNPSEVTLEAGEAAEIAIVGEYDPEYLNGFYGGLLVTDVSEFDSSSEVTFRGRAVATFRLRGPEPWDASVQPEVSNIIQNGESEVMYYLRMRNTGKVDVIVGGEVEANFNGEIVTANLTEERIYPGLCALLGTKIDYSQTNFTDGQVTFNALPRVQTFPSTDNRNTILELENVDFSSAFQFEKGKIAGNNYEIQLFDIQEIVDDGQQALLVQYRVQNIGSLSGSPSVKLSLGEPGDIPQVAGRTYSSLSPQAFAEGEAIFYVNEGVYDVTINITEGASKYGSQTQRQTVLGQSSAFDQRLLLLLLPLIYLLYLVFNQRQKIKELEK